MSKIICVGFHKTGTTSIGSALEILGYSVVGARIDLADLCAKKKFNKVLSIMDYFDACQDNPWPLLYKELDHKYPGSRFILTLRPSEDWFQSALNHFGDRKTSMRKWIYGLPSVSGNKKIFIERIEQHNSEVKKWFVDRPNSLLELNITNGDGWEKLCPFLNKPIPSRLFPYLNNRR